MTGLDETVASLARFRRLAAGQYGLAGAASDASPSRLTETHGWGANPGNLRMLSYAPLGVERGGAMVVVLHGCTQTAEAYAEGAGWLTLADRHGFVVLCPEQQASNNPNRCFNWFQPQDTGRGLGEAESIEQMIRRAVADHGVDPARVFVTGLSAGGAMACVMLADYPETFAGGAIIAGLPFDAAHNVQEAFGAMFQGRTHTAQAWGDRVRDASPHSGPWPRLSIWQGDADATVKPVNAEEIAKQWADVHGLSASRDGTTPREGWRRREWATPKGQVMIELNMIKGMAHGTPLAAEGSEGCGRAGPFLLEVGVSSSREILRFWGLASERLEQGAPAPRAEAAEAAVPPPRPKLVHAVARPARPFGGVEQVITKALAGAGLIKPGSASKNRSSR